MVSGREHERLEDDIKGLLALQADLESEIAQLNARLTNQASMITHYMQRLDEATDLLQKWYEHQQYWQATGQWLQGVNG